MRLSRNIVLATLGFGLLGAGVVRAYAMVLKLPEEAVKAALPEAEVVDIRNVILTRHEVHRAQELARASVDQRLVSFYVGRKGGQVVGYAAFDTHIVRTKPETFLVCIDPAGRLRSVELISFYEPSEYMPPSRWLTLFVGKTLRDSLRVQGDIPNMTGASMTARAVSTGARRLLAIHQVVFGL